MTRKMNDAVHVIRMRPVSASIAVRMRSGDSCSGSAPIEV